MNKQERDKQLAFVEKLIKGFESIGFVDYHDKRTVYLQDIEGTWTWHQFKGKSEEFKRLSKEFKVFKSFVVNRAIEIWVPTVKGYKQYAIENKGKGFGIPWRDIDEAVLISTGCTWNKNSHLDEILVHREWQIGEIELPKYYYYMSKWVLNDIEKEQNKLERLDTEKWLLKGRLRTFMEDRALYLLKIHRDDILQEELREKVDIIELKQPTQKVLSRRVLNQHM